MNLLLAAACFHAAQDWNGIIQPAAQAVRMKLADPPDLDCERAGLLGMEPEPDQLQDIFGNAGFDGATGVDSAIRNNCMLSAGFSMLAESDDSYNEV